VITKAKHASHRIHIVGRRRSDLLVLNLVGFRGWRSSIGSIMGVLESNTAEYHILLVWGQVSFMQRAVSRSKDVSVTE